MSENKRQVGSRWRRGDIVGETNEVEGPKVEILETLPETGRIDSLSVVHVALGGIITKKSVDENLFLVLAEPTSLATENTSSLAGTSRHKEPRENSNDGGDCTLDEETVFGQIGPCNATELLTAISIQRDHGFRAFPRCQQPKANPQCCIPKELSRTMQDGKAYAQSVAYPNARVQINVQLTSLVKVGQVKDGIGNESSHEQSEKTAAGVVCSFRLKTGLCSRDDGPRDNNEWDPAVRAEFLADEAAGKFC